MEDGYIELTAKQRQVYLAGFRVDPNGNPYRFIIAHGATGAGKSLSSLLGFMKWAALLHRNTHFAIFVPSELTLYQVTDWMRHMISSGDFDLGALSDCSIRTVMLDTNTFHIYPLKVEYADDSAHITHFPLLGFIPSGLYFLQPTNVSQEIFERLVSHLPENRSKVWVSLDAGDPASFWKTDYIDKEEMAGTLAIEFDLDDVQDNPGVDSAWKSEMRRWLEDPNTNITMRRKLSGIWLPEEGQQAGWLASRRYRKAVESRKALDERLAAATAVLANPSSSFLGYLNHRTIQAAIHWEAPYRALGYSTGDELIQRLQALLRGSNRALREEALRMIEGAAADELQEDDV